MRTSLRLHVDAALGPEQTVPLGPDAAHYLGAVMRRSVGDRVALFNGRDGEWTAALTALGKKTAEAVCQAQTAPQRDAPDIWLLFAPLKKTPTDFLVEKATELGVRRLMPVATRRTNSDRVRPERMRRTAIEAAEQCGGTDVPQIDDLLPLDRALAALDRPLLWCDEAGSGGAMPDAPAAALLIGPEGGFAPEEAAALAARPGTVPIALGPRILRAETAAAAALTLWHARHGW